MKYLVDEYGEILEEIRDGERYAVLDVGDMILRRNSLRSYKEKTANIKIDYPYIKLNTSIAFEYFKKYSLLSYLCCHVGYMDNVCRYDNGKIITFNSLVNKLKISKTTLSRQIKEMVKDDLIHKIKIENKNAYMVNPCLCMYGQSILKSTYLDFKSSPLTKYVNIKGAVNEL
ncbi:MAG: replication/maintenance protein RepL [Bacilli bacterium]|nr:replication/maintenance protein RepL [Bacilli bacterium]